jgi:hypothetical protein
MSMIKYRPVRDSIREPAIYSKYPEYLLVNTTDGRGVGKILITDETRRENSGSDYLDTYSIASI